MTSSTTPQSSLPASLLAAHPPQIKIRAAWYSELTGQEATYFPSVIGNETFLAPPSGNPPVAAWRNIRDGILTQATKTLFNFAVFLEGTEWLKDDQPVSWAVTPNAFVSIETDADFAMTSIFGDQQMVGIALPNPAVPDPNNVHAAGKLGVAVTITGTYADNSTISGLLTIYPFAPPAPEGSS